MLAGKILTTKNVTLKATIIFFPTNQQQKVSKNLIPYIVKIRRSQYKIFELPAYWKQIIFFPIKFSAPCNSESCIKIKVNLHFYFHTSLWCLKKPFEKGQHLFSHLSLNSFTWFVYTER